MHQTLCLYWTLQYILPAFSALITPTHILYIFFSKFVYVWVFFIKGQKGHNFCLKCSVTFNEKTKSYFVMWLLGNLQTTVQIHHILTLNKILSEKCIQLKSFGQHGGKNLTEFSWKFLFWILLLLKSKNRKTKKRFSSINRTKLPKKF